MLLSVVFGAFISVVGFGRLVVGDPGTVITISSAKVTNNANDYFDPWNVEIAQTKMSSQLTAKIPTKKELPDTMQIKITVVLGDQDPIEYVTSVCEAMSDEMVGKSFFAAGIPKDKFPKECPFGVGDWTIMKWNPPASIVPPGIPDGPIHGTLMIMEEGKEPCVQIDYEGKLSHSLPGLGR